MAIKLPRVIDRTSFIVRIKLEFFNKSTKKTDFCSYFSNNQELPKYKIAARSSKLTKLKTKGCLLLFCSFVDRKVDTGPQLFTKGASLFGHLFPGSRNIRDPNTFVEEKVLVETNKSCSEFTNNVQVN